ncbi:MAG: LamG-like jellyroll fold domain-containing protein, partial [Vicinamibacterales bacterium]
MPNLRLLGSISYTTGRFGRALRGGYAEVPSGLFNRGPSADWTIEWWATRISESNGLFVSSLTDTFNQWYVGHDATHATLNGRATPMVVGDGGWHHFRLVLIAWSGALTLYVDGVCAATQTVLATGPEENNRSFIGAIWSGRGDTIFISSPIAVDECAVFSYARTTGGSVGATCFTVPTAPHTGDEAGLVALWHLDGDDGDAAGPRRVAADDPALLYSPGNWASGTAVNP